jgi:hypothetical protein
VSKGPTIVAIHTKEAACRDALEAELRAWGYHDLPQCTGSALAVSAPDKIDVPVPTRRSEQ